MLLVDLAGEGTAPGRKQIVGGVSDVLKGCEGRKQQGTEYHSACPFSWLPAIQVSAEL